MGTPHNAAKKGEIASTVLMPGDPLRAKYIADTYLEDARCFNTVRNMLGYTGTYKGREISVMGGGMGMPSVGIYTYELYHMYDVEAIIRIGSAGALRDDIRLKDIVIGMGACTDSNYASQYQLPGTFAPIADYGLLEKAVNTASCLLYTSIGNAAGIFSSFLSALLLAGAIVMGIVMTLLISRILSGTILKGLPSSFALELPPYRKPQIGKVIVRSVLDRTIFVLGRAIAVAAPAGLVIWCMANLKAGDVTVLALCADFLDPFARLMGLDGIILLAFILGMPANEIVMPIAVMCYLAQGSLLELGDSQAMWTLLSQNGWTWVTAISTILFSMMHWPCATTCLTIRKETGSVKWMLVSILVPTIAGILLCMAFTFIARLVMA